VFQLRLHTAEARGEVHANQHGMAKFALLMLCMSPVIVVTMMSEVLL
jgi:hypothetical protein